MKTVIQINLSRIVLIVVMFPSILFLQSAAAEPIMITISTSMDEIIFDGKWTTDKEWKHTSLNTFEGHGVAYLRSAHQGNYVYLMVDFVGDKTIDWMVDRCIICFDTKNDKTVFPQEDDFCFIATLGSENGSILKGDSTISSQDYFKKIPNPDGFIAIGTVSDENDRYSKTPHASYEFRIPTDLIGRSDNYGFLVYIFDANTNKITTWPESIVVDETKRIPSPSQWGDLVSPDKSLPEFNSKLILLFLSLTPILLLNRFKKNLVYKAN